MVKGHSDANMDEHNNSRALFDSEDKNTSFENDSNSQYKELLEGF
ncbi:MAG: hypothetical protein AABX11_02995 [Nanoarchaeota archaeon]